MASTWIWWRWDRQIETDMGETLGYRYLQYTLTKLELSSHETRSQIYLQTDQRGVRNDENGPKDFAYPVVTHTRCLLIYPGNWCRVGNFLFAQMLQMLPGGLSVCCLKDTRPAFSISQQCLRGSKKASMVSAQILPSSAAAAPNRKYHARHVIKRLLANKETKSVC